MDLTPRKAPSGPHGPLGQACRVQIELPLSRSNGKAGDLAQSARLCYAPDDQRALRLVSYALKRSARKDAWTDGILRLHLVIFFSGRGVPPTSATFIFALLSIFAMVCKLANDALFGIGMRGPPPISPLLFREFSGQTAIGAILGACAAVYSTGMVVGG